MMNNASPQQPYSQSNPTTPQHHGHQGQQQYIFQQPHRFFQAQGQPSRMMLMDPRGYHHHPSGHPQPSSLPSLMQAPTRPNNRGPNNQWGKQPCVICNEIYLLDQLSHMACGHRICTQCITTISQPNGYIPPEKCPPCSMMINSTANLTSLLSNSNIRDAFNSQNVSPIGFPTATSSTPTNAQTPNMDNTFSIWEPLPLGREQPASRNHSFSSSYKPNTTSSTPSQGYHGYRKPLNASASSSLSQNVSHTPLGLQPKSSLQFQFKERENNNETQAAATRQQLPSKVSGMLLPNSSIKCTNCDEKAANVVGYCLDCKEYLCSDCIMAHARVKITKEHKIQGIDETYNLLHFQGTSTPTTRTHSDSASIKADSDSPNSFSGNSFSIATSCPEHDLFYVSVCTTCTGIQLCLRCLPNHIGHSLRILPVYESQASLRRLISESKNVQRSLEDSKETIKRMQERIEASVQAVVGEMRSIIHLHISALEERKRDLLQRVDSIHQMKLATLSQQNEKINERMKALDALIRYGEQLCTSSGSNPSSLSGSSPTDEDPKYFECYEKLIKLHSDTFIPLIPSANDAIRLRSIDPKLLQALKTLGHVESGLCPKTSQLLGTRFKRAITGRPCVINMQMKDVCGDPVGRESREQGGEFICTLYGPISNGHAALQHADIIDRENGVCSLLFAPKRVGIYRLNITYCQIPITGCPTEISVCSGRDYKDAQTQGQKFSFGKEGSGDGEFSRPWGICCDLKGRILVADRSNHRIQVFDGRGNFLLKFGHRGIRQGEFNRPAGICVNPSNDIIIADKDNHRIQVFYDNGGFSHGFGSRGCSPGLFNYPWGVATNNNYEIAVTDTRNHRVQVFSSTGVMLKMCTIDSEIKRSPSSPRGICWSPDNELIVSDFNTHRLAVVNANGEPRFFGLEGTAPGFFHRPQGLAIDPDGLVLVCDSRSNRVQVLNIYDLTVVAVLGNDTKYQRPDSMSGGADKFLDTTLFRQTPADSHHQSSSQVANLNANLLEHPMDVCVSPDGLVYVVDFGNNCIRVY